MARGLGLLRIVTNLLHSYDAAGNNLIVVVGAEPSPPYQRPPLSKAYLLGQMGLDRLALRSPEWWDDQRITLRPGETATAVDPARRIVTTGTGEIGYDALALTTGASARRLPAAMGGDLPGVHVIRNLADVDALAPQMQPGRHLVDHRRVLVTLVLGVGEDVGQQLVGAELGQRPPERAHPAGAAGDVRSTRQVVRCRRGEEPGRRERPGRQPDPECGARLTPGCRSR